MFLRIRTRLDVVLWVGREIDDVCREPGYDEQHDRYQNRQHNETILPRHDAFRRLTIRLSTLPEVDTVFTRQRLSELLTFVFNNLTLPQGDTRFQKISYDIPFVPTNGFPSHL